MAKKVKLKSNTHLFLLILILSILLYVLWISRIFLIPAITAAILSFVSYPFFKKIKTWTGKPRLSAIITLFVLTFLILVPLIAAFIIISNETITFLANFKVTDFFESIENVREHMNNIFNLSLTQTDFEGILMNGFTQARQRIMSYSFQILNGVTNAIFQIFFILIFMFYFFLHGKKARNYIIQILPFSDQNKERLQLEVENDIRALILGQGLMAIIQGIVTGLGFFIFGVPNVLLWGFVTMIASFLPIIGTWITWGPAAIYLLVSGNPFHAIGMVLWGLLISMNVDSFLRPMLVQSMAKINFLVVLVGVIIGVRAFGVIGFVLGPLILSILIALIRIYIDEETELTTKNGLKDKKKKSTVR